MKFKISKKIVSLFLAVMMVVTSVPAFAINASAADTDVRDSYLFAYFTGDDNTADAVNQRVRFALSKDGVNFTSLNGNSPILTNDKTSGTITWTNKTGMPHTKGVRDPFIIKKPNNEAGYYIVATDLRVGENGGSYNNSKILVWDVNDLSKADKVSPWIIETSGMFGDTYYSNGKINGDYVAWAPEVTYDYDTNMYMIYWSGPLYQSSTILCAYTRDFKTFYQDSLGERPLDGAGVRPNTLFSESGQNTIDADIVYDSSNSKYYMVYKRESEKQLYFVKADSLDGFKGKTGTKFVDSRYSGLEGPELYKRADGKWTLIADRYTENGGAGSAGKFAMYVAGSIDEFMTGAEQGSKEVTTNINECSPRHGAVTTITSAEYTALNEAYGGASESEGALVARYFTSSDTTADTTGHGYTLSIPNGGVSYVKEFNGVKNAVHFDATVNNTSGSNPIYAKVGTADMMSKYNFNINDGMTITFKAYDELNDGTSGYTGFFTLTETPNATPGSMTEDKTNYSHYDTAYMFLLDGLCRGISSGTPGSANGSTEYASDTLGNQWVDYKIVISGQGYKVYRNGEEKASMTSANITDQWYKDLFDDGTLLLGTTLFSPDKNYKGYLADFRIYSTGNQNTVADIKKKTEENDINKEYESIINNLNSDTANNASPETINGKAYYTGNNVTFDVPTGMYKNVLYGSKTTSFSSNNKNNYMNKTTAISRYTVLAYDGVNTPAYPAIAELWPGAKKNVILVGGTYSGTAPFKFNSNWSGYHYGNRDSNIFDVTTNKVLQNTTSNQGSKGTVASTEFNFGTNTGFPTNNGHYWWTNTLYYTGTGNTDTYYEHYSNSNIQFSIAHRNDDWGWKNRLDTSSPTNDVYVINYKPVYDILNNSATATVSETGKSYTFKGLYNEVYPAQWKYTDSTVRAYLVAVNKLISLNLNSTFSDANDSNVDSKVSSTASAIKEAYSDYINAVTNLKTKTITVNFSFDNGDVTTKKIPAGSTLAGIVPSNTEIGSNNNGTHRVYTWSDNCSESTVPQKDTTYYETFENVDCSFGAPTTVDGVTTKKCTVCGYTKTEINLNKDAYNAAVTKADDAIKNTAKYTEESRNELKSVLDNNKSENAKSQTELDAMTKAIETAYNTRLVLNQYTINLYTVIDDVVPATPTETIEHKYGEEFTFDSNLGDGYTVQKWVRNVNNNEEKVGSSVTSLTGITYANANYYVYAVKAKDTKENNAVVSLKDRNNRVVDNMYVELKDGTANLDVSVDVNNKCVRVGGVELNAIDLTFYKIVGFKINGVEYKENANISLDINGDLTIETLYDIANSYTITTDDSCSASVTSAYWDQKVTVTAKNGSANTKWYVDGKVVAYGPTYTFRATRNISISCANNDDAFSAVATVESLSYNNPIEKTITVVGSFNVPEDCTVVEKGVLMKTSSVNNPDAVRKIENYTGEKANARKFIAKNYVKDTNQYVINVYSSKAYTDLCVGAVAYVTYTDASGQPHTAYSELVVINQNNA